MYKRYAALRDERGLTDYKSSQMTGIRTSTLSDWRHNLYQPKLDKLLLIAKALGVSINELIGDVNEEQQ